MSRRGQGLFSEFFRIFVEIQVVVKSLRFKMNYPWMCGSSMGMVFCPASYEANSGLGFSIIFKSWVISDSKSYATACLGVFMMGVARQLISCLRGYLPMIQARLRASGGAAAPTSIESLEALIPTSKPRSIIADAFTRYPSLLPCMIICADTVLFAASLFLAYLNMLVAMVYDAGLLASLVAGEAVTYFTTRVISITMGSVPLKMESGATGCCAE